MQISPNAIKAIVYLIIFIIAFSLFQFLMLVHPFKIKTKVRPEDLRLTYENVSFKTQDGLTLKGWFIPSMDADATIIVLHGYPADKNNLLGTSAFLLSKYNLFLFDFRYFGESEGLFTTGGLKEKMDIEAAIKYLRSRNDTGKIGVLGFSLGASAILYANPKEVDAIVADSPYANMDILLNDIYWIFPLFTKYPFVWLTKMFSWMFFKTSTKEISPLNEIKISKTPIFLIHGENDKQIPIKHSRLLYENSNKNTTEFWAVPKSKHGWTMALYPVEYKEKIMGFFDKHLQ